MSKRDYKLFLSDILESIRRIETYTSGLTFEDFEKNTIVSDAVVRNLEIIAEAIKNIPPEITEKYTQIPWKKVIGFRNIVIHAYFTVDLKNVWYIVKEQLPELKILIEKIIKEGGK
ncbi:MAG: DUF86 domain-containing protein [Candidatus Methanoperedens sp.]|nr:DUF86 domain-containing protein [Candidatus Methanoperedens sp.]MCZ7371124.1 DUF86 domain-containing protein [Candidatus Methanoperedens sp.]